MISFQLETEIGVQRWWDFGVSLFVGDGFRLRLNNGFESGIELLCSIYLDLLVDVDRRMTSKVLDFVVVPANLKSRQATCNLKL